MEYAFFTEFMTGSSFVHIGTKLVCTAGIECSSVRITRELHRCSLLTLGARPITIHSISLLVCAISLNAHRGRLACKTDISRHTNISTGCVTCVMFPGRMLSPLPNALFEFKGTTDSYSLDCCCSCLREIRRALHCRWYVRGPGGKHFFTPNSLLLKIVFQPNV